MRIKAGDLHLNYEIYGESGDWLVMCHGLGAGLRSLRNAAERLSDKFRVLIWDNRGIGESDTAPPGSDYSIKTHARDLANLMDALGIEKAIVHGVSWGGVLGLRFVIDYPEKVRAFICDSSSAEVNERAAQNWIARGEAYVREGPAGIRNAPGGLNDGNRQAPSAQPAPSLAQASGGPQADPTAYLETCKAVASLYEHPMNQDLPGIRVPMLAIVGEDDQTAGVGGTVKIARAVPDCKLVIVPATGHGVYSQNFEVFRKELEELAARVAVA
ncbi:MAG TPA: alpha/beta hydrolase [Dehalococcoidia bacterium]|nr:alpha/beta hydrolase [Dehalococcoidia bacterium]